METKIYNIDSSIVTKTSSNSFTYNSMNLLVGGVTTIEPFNEKNVIEINILSIELPQGMIPDSYPASGDPYTYFFLRINDFGNIINLKTRYVAKINIDIPLSTLSTKQVFNIITSKIKLDQPTDIKELKVSLEYPDGTLVDMNSKEFSFSFELTTITNAILKDYSEVRFYSEPVMERILQSKMLAYFEKKIEPREDISLTGVYNKNLTNFNNVMEYTPNGNRNNYNMIQPSYFKNND